MRACFSMDEGTFIGFYDGLYCTTTIMASTTALYSCSLDVSLSLPLDVRYLLFIVIGLNLRRELRVENPGEFG